MPSETTEQKEALHKYRTDPVFNAIIDTLVSRVAGDNKIKAYAATDFFLLGLAMVADPSQVNRPNLNPFDFEILPDGRAKYTRPVPEHILKEHGEPILDADLFLLLTFAGPTPPPPRKGENSTIQGWEPWVEGWQKVEGSLDVFLAR